MRINILNTKRGSAHQLLAKHLVQLVAQEFQVDTKKLWEQLYTGHEPLGHMITAHLRKLGWQIDWYVLPCPVCSDVVLHGEYPLLSTGFIIQDNCDLLIQWNLSHA